MIAMNLAHAQSIATLTWLIILAARWYRRRVASIRTAPRDVLLLSSLLILASYTLWSLAVPTAQAWGQLSLMTLYVVAGWAAYRWPQAARYSVISVAAVMMLSVYGESIGAGGRVDGWMNANVTAEIMLQALPHLQWPLLIGGALVAAMMTGSRGALAGFGAAFAWITTPARWRRWLAIAAPVILIAAAIPLATLRPGSTVDRLLIWQDALWMIRQRPVLGWGLGSFALHAPRMGYWMHAHNLLLNVIVEQGMVGLSLWMAWLSAAVWLLIAHHRRFGAHILQVAVLAYLLHQVVDVIWTVPVGSMVAVNLAWMARSLEAEE